MTSFRPTILALAMLILSTPAVMARDDSHATPQAGARTNAQNCLLKTWWIQPRRTTSTDRARRALKGLRMQLDAKRTCDLEDSREARIAVPAQCPVEALATQPGLLRHL